MQMRRPRLTSAELKFIKRLPEAWREGLERLLREICSTSKGSKGQKSEKSVTHSVVSDSLTPWTAAHWTLCPWDSPGKNTRVGCHGLLQGIFPTQGSNLGLPQCRWTLYYLNHQRSPNAPLLKVIWQICCCLVTKI